MAPKTPTIPDGGAQWPDVERAMVTLLNEWAKELTPEGLACVVPPKNYEDLIQNGAAIITVQRIGGPAQGIFDHAQISVQVTTATRSASWDVLGWIRPRLHDYTGIVSNDDGTTAIIADVKELQGPQKTPDIVPDLRRVQAMFTIQTRLER